MHWLLLVPLALTSAGSEQAHGATGQKLDLGPIAAEVDCGPEVVPLYDAVAVAVTMTAPASVEVEWPTFAESSDDYRVIDVATEGPDRVGRFLARRWRVRLEPLAIGKLSLAALAVRYRDGTSEWRVGQIALPTIEIVAGPTSSADPATLRPIVALPAPARPDWLPRALRWTAVGIVLLVLGGWAIRDRRRRIAPATPQSAALAKLDALARQPLAEQDARQAAGAVSQIVREYLEGRYRIAAACRTTPELTAELARCPRFPGEQRSPLEHLLAAADPQKFAGPRPRLDAVHDLIDNCREFLSREPR